MSSLICKADLYGTAEQNVVLKDGLLTNFTVIFIHTEPLIAHHILFVHTTETAVAGVAFILTCLLDFATYM